MAVAILGSQVALRLTASPTRTVSGAFSAGATITMLLTAGKWQQKKHEASGRITLARSASRVLGTGCLRAVKPEGKAVQKKLYSRSCTVEIV
jgi:hypothetical protein